MLFSATMPGPIITLARAFLNQPTHIRAEETDASAIHERTAQFVYRAHALDKIEVVARALQADGRGLTMIFTRTKRTAQKISDELTERGFAAAAVHGDLGQGAREQALRAFRAGKVDVLVATDVAARGIDVEGVTHVINYQCPEDEKTYIHRIGRTGRAGRTGVAVTLVDWDEEPRWKLISDTLGLDKPEPAETYSTSEHLQTDLGIGADATGRLPLGQRTRAGLSAEPMEKLNSADRKPQRSRRRGSDRVRSERPATEESKDGDQRPRRRRTRRGGTANGQQSGEQRQDTRPETPTPPAGESSGDRAGGRRRRTRRRAGADVAADKAPQGENKSQDEGSN
jgi:superfamily II DNA/RNA helicase